MSNATASRLGVVNGATPTDFATENGLRALAEEGQSVTELTTTLPN